MDIEKVRTISRIESGSAKPGHSEARLALIKVTYRPLSLCALYRQSQQARHSRWRGWMLRPRVIRLPTNPEWEVAGSSPTSRSVLFLHFCWSSLFFLRLTSPSGLFFFIVLPVNKKLSCSKYGRPLNLLFRALSSTKG